MIDSPEPLVGELDVDERPVVGPPGSAAVLVDPGADVGARRRDLFSLPAPQIATHHRGAPAFVGPALGPPQEPGLHRIGNDLGDSRRPLYQARGRDG